MHYMGACGSNLVLETRRSKCRDILYAGIIGRRQKVSKTTHRMQEPLIVGEERSAQRPYNC